VGPAERPALSARALTATGRGPALRRLRWDRLRHHWTG
jgi:hypothetical protein